MVDAATRKVLEHILPSVQNCAGGRKVAIGGSDLSFRRTTGSGMLTVQVLVCGRYPDQKLEVCAISRSGIEVYKSKIDVPTDLSILDLSVLESKINNL